MDSEKKNLDPVKPGTSVRRKAVNTIISLCLMLLILCTAGLEFLQLTEYRPDKVEEIEVNPVNRELIGPGEELSVLTWNCGYCALGDNADYFMDGGSSVYTADKERVLSNLEGITEAAAGMNPDVIFFQEVDRGSSRSRGVDEMITMNNELQIDHGLEYTSSYTYDYNVRFVPYPVPPIGKVQSGLLTFCGMRAEAAERIRLPSPFKWPVRLAGHKRCLLIEYVPLQNSEKYLVLINLHLETFDEGEGKAQQMEILREIIGEEVAAGNYVIAGGDFTETFSNADISAYPAQEGVWKPGELDTEELGEGLQCIMDSTVPTCRSLDKPYADADKDNFQYYVIDGFIVSSNIEVKSCETKDLGFVYTDHNPVLMKCVLK